MQGCSMSKYVQIVLYAPLVEALIAGLVIDFTKSSPWFYLLLFFIVYIQGIGGAVKVDYMHDTLSELATISKCTKKNKDPI